LRSHQSCSSRPSLEPRPNTAVCSEPKPAKMAVDTPQPVSRVRECGPTRLAISR
jgi:hypothetical protein